MSCTRDCHVQQAHLVLLQHQASVDGLEAKIIGYFHRFPFQPFRAVNGRDYVVSGRLGRDSPRQCTQIDSPPQGIEPLEWMLLSSVPTTSLDEALERLAWYARRFCRSKPICY